MVSAKMRHRCFIRERPHNIINTAAEKSERQSSTMVDAAAMSRIDGIGFTDLRHRPDGWMIVTIVAPAAPQVDAAETTARSEQPGVCTLVAARQWRSASSGLSHQFSVLTTFKQERLNIDGGPPLHTSATTSTWWFR
jgi:hypothetical protein